MSDDMEKTEEPTPKKRDDAREEGRVPRSPELGVAAGLVGGALVLKGTGPALAAFLLSTMGASLASIGSTATDLDAEGAATLVRGLGMRTLMVLGMTTGSLALVALAVGAAQGRGIVSMKPLGPNFGKLNPAENIKRVAGPQSWMEAAKQLLKLLLVGLVVRSVLRDAWPSMLALAQQSPLGFFEVVRRYSLDLLMTAGIAYLGLAALDYGWQLWQHEKSLKMSKQEVKQESKQSEGDPMVKSRQRALGRAMARKQMMKDVPKADVVVVNPVHIAVALKYDGLIAPAPIVLAIGQRKVAERIKALAYEHGIPVIENKPLARGLLAAKVQPGSIIPAEMYVAVAEILAFVFRQRRARSGAWAGSASA